MKAFKDFNKSFEAPQRVRKIKIYIYFLHSPKIGTGRVKYESQNLLEYCKSEIVVNIYFIDTVVHLLRLAEKLNKNGKVRVQRFIYSYPTSYNGI